VDGKTARFGAGLVVFVCFLVATIEGYDIQAFGVASPKLVHELGLGPGQQGWAGAAAMIGLMIGAIVGGRLADRIGRKPVLLASVALFGLFTLATAMSPSYEVLLWARLATGLGLGGALPNLIAVANEVTPAAPRHGHDHGDVLRHAGGRNRRGPAGAVRRRGPGLADDLRRRRDRAPGAAAGDPPAAARDAAAGAGGRGSAPGVSRCSAKAADRPPC
jgi:MFS family permease